MDKKCVERISLCFTVLFMLFAMSCSDKSTDNYPYEAAWETVFEDHFEGTTLDAESWSALERGGNWNGEDQAYDPANARVEDGNLILLSEEKTWTGPVNNPHHPDASLGTVTRDYVSAQVETKGKKSWLYGRFECRAKLSCTNGMLNAIWMCPKDNSWPPEIDIAEVLGHAPWNLTVTNHYGTQENHEMKSFEHVSYDELTTEYHIYAIEWEPNEIRWYLDGILVFTSRQGVPSKPMYFIMCPAIGPNWTGNPTDYTDYSFPQEMCVDYVLISQRKGSAR